MPALNFRTVKIAKPDGTNVVTLSPQTISIQDPYPEMNAKANNKSYQMRRTSSRPGPLSMEIFRNGFESFCR